MKNANFSPELKRRIAAILALLIVFSAAILFLLKKPQKEKFYETDGAHYDIVKDYMQSQYTEAYSDYFEVAYVEGLSDYRESFNKDENIITAEFVMNTYYKYPYRDPDTLPKVIEARENGDMAEYKRLYDECNAPKSADYRLKIEASLENGLVEGAHLFGGGKEGEWIFLENGLKDYITEE